MSKQRGLHPPIEPYETGMLDVGGGHHLYWECCGNPDGRPAVVLHGGPGSGATDAMRRYFDPHRYRVVLFDQRNCGRSTPNAADPRTDLSTNTTEALLDDLETLRAHLDIERWVILGFSWGTVLGLAYAERHPHRTSALLLAGVSAGRHSEVDWLYRGAGQFLPEEWERFDRGGDNVAAYHAALENPATAQQAADDWSAWEWALMSLDPTSPPAGRWLDPDWTRARARIVTHYFAHKMFIEDGALLDGIDRIRDIPGAIIHGRLDISGPLESAWLLHKRWPIADFTVVATAGHSALDPGMPEAIVAATDKFGGILHSTK